MHQHQRSSFDFNACVQMARLFEGFAESAEFVEPFESRADMLTAMSDITGAIARLTKRNLRVRGFIATHRSELTSMYRDALGRIIGIRMTQERFASRRDEADTALGQVLVDRMVRNGVDAAQARLDVFGKAPESAPQWAREPLEVA